MQPDQIDWVSRAREEKEQEASLSGFKDYWHLDLSLFQFLQRAQSVRWVLEILHIENELFQWRKEVLQTDLKVVWKDDLENGGLRLIIFYVNEVSELVRKEDYYWAFRILSSWRVEGPIY